MVLKRTSEGELRNKLIQILKYIYKYKTCSEFIEILSVMFVFSVPYINIYYLDKADISKIINFSDLKTMPIFIFCLI